MRTIIALTLLHLALWGCSTAAHTGPTSIALFDGRTLNGWVQRGGRAEYRVEDGTIVGVTSPNQPNSFLCTTAEYSNFILDLDFKVDQGLNSGIQIRSESRPEYKNGVVHGYQVEIDTTDRAWTAGLYDESRRGWLFPLDKSPAARSAFKPGEWNHLRIRAEGDRIQTWLNGVPATDFRDSMTGSGFIALQVHGVGERQTEQRVRFKEMMLRPLP